jgi:hypothetical protein
LAENVKKAGYILPSPHNKTSPAGPSAKTKVLITVQQLEEQASYIVQQSKNLVLPQYVLSAARRAINVRSRCATWFENFSQRTVIVYMNIAIFRSNERDGPNAGTACNASRRWRKACRATEDGNKYELLDFQDPPQQEDVFAVAAEGPPQPDPSAIEDENAKMSAAYEDNQFRQDVFNFYCIITDIDNIRRHVKTVWEDYR